MNVPTGVTSVAGMWFLWAERMNPRALIIAFCWQSTANTENVAAQPWLWLKAALEVNIEIPVYIALHKKIILQSKATF